MKGKGVRNLQHEYTAKTPLSYIVSSKCHTSKRPFLVPVQAITSHRKANEEDNQSICYACLNITRDVSRYSVNFA